MIDMINMFINKQVANKNKVIYSSTKDYRNFIKNNYNIYFLHLFTYINNF